MARSARQTFTWEDRQVVTAVSKKMATGVREAMKHMRREIRAELGGPAGSAPGGPPGKAGGRLQQAVAYRVKVKRNFIAGDVGILRPSRMDEKFPGEMHAIAVRLARGYAGTDRNGRSYSEAPRPFIDQVAARESGRVARIVATATGGSLGDDGEETS